MSKTTLRIAKLMQGKDTPSLWHDGLSGEEPTKIAKKVMDTYMNCIQAKKVPKLD